MKLAGKPARKALARNVALLSKLKAKLGFAAAVLQHRLGFVIQQSESDCIPLLSFGKGFLDILRKI
jgi:hypothetical protein